jgi:glutamyl-Q tRNA(Asp) synthetase
MPQNVVTRFAPSPTGRLHLGHAWSALCAHDLAREAGGAFLLRIEDIDTARCRAEFVDGIFEDLRWLGFDWDGEVMFQSQRTAHYQAALAALIDRGLAYRCWCTRTEIAAAAAAAPHGDYGPLYPGTCRGRSDPGDGRPYCWRLDVLKAVRTTGPLRWRDFREGPVIASPQMLGDVVIARKDAETSYHLAVTLDDAAQEVSHVVRGIDLFRSTHLHRLLQALFHLPPPEYRHHDLVVDDDGERLAKRRNAPTIASLRQAGVDPIRLISGMRDGRFPVGFHLPDD